MASRFLVERSNDCHLNKTKLFFLHILFLFQNSVNSDDYGYIPISSIRHIRHCSVHGSPAPCSSQIISKYVAFDFSGLYLRSFLSLFSTFYSSLFPFLPFFLLFLAFFFSFLLLLLLLLSFFLSYFVYFIERFLFDFSVRQFIFCYTGSLFVFTFVNFIFID